MSETLAASILALVGVVVLCFAGVILALKTRGDRVIAWRGFGVTFTVTPCRGCPASGVSSQPERITDQ